MTKEYHEIDETRKDLEILRKKLEFKKRAEKEQAFKNQQLDGSFYMCVYFESYEKIKKFLTQIGADTKKYFFSADEIFGEFLQFLEQKGISVDSNLIQGGGSILKSKSKISDDDNFDDDTQDEEEDFDVDLDLDLD